MMDLKSIEQDFEKTLTQLSPFNQKSLEQLKLQFLGKKGVLNQVQKIKDLPPSQRPQFGKSLNILKQKIETKWLQLKEKLEDTQVQESLEKSLLDPTLPGDKMGYGSIHPLNQVRQEIIDFFSKLGFQIELGREVETEWYNFDALNVPADHPARDMQDTFYIDKNTVLRTQTSNVQIHIMEAQKPPIRVIAPGHVYRADSDASHAPMFQQVEGLVVDKDISFAHLKGIIYLWVKSMFGVQIKLRFRPSFFPFTEPSAEMDISCPFCHQKGCRVCKNSGWIEIGGCGCVDPNVFEKVGIDCEEYQGFAFGFGIDRITMLKYQIPDIGLLTTNDNRFLKQF